MRRKFKEHEIAYWKGRVRKLWKGGTASKLGAIKKLNRELRASGLLLLHSVPAFYISKGVIERYTTFNKIRPAFINEYINELEWRTI